MYFQGYLTGYKIAEEIALPFSGVVDQILETLKREKLIEVRSSQMGLGEGAYLYAITGPGIARAREALDRSQYAGPAPVPLDVYNDACRHQAAGSMTGYQPGDAPGAGNPGPLRTRSSSSLGPAVNSGTSIFIYGPPGNGKTSYRPCDRQHDHDPVHLHPLCHLC